MPSRYRTLAVAITLGLCWLFCLGGTPALAHAALEGSAPENGALLSAAPESVRLTFSEDLGGGSLAVTAGGASVAAGAAKVEGSDLVVGVVPGAPAGTWTVAYRVVSADGHPVSGQFTFTVKAQPARATPTKTPTGSPSPTAAPSTSATPGASALPPAESSGHVLHSPVAQTAAAAVALVALVLGVFVRRRRP